MQIAKTHHIQIDWEGPYKLDELHTLQNEETDYGIYQIYGKHQIYGSDVLLYIGKADQQTVGKRILQEGWEYVNDSNNIKIYIGRLHGRQTPTNDEWSREIDLAESLLIYVHKPAFNSKSIASVSDTELQDIHILNWGNHRDLLPEVSGLRWTSKLDDMNYEVYKFIGYEEIRKPIEGYEGYYEISETGKIYSVKSQRFMARSDDEYGFHIVKLSKNGISKNYNVYKLWKEEFPNLSESMFKGAKERIY
ncbi:NUMOD4 motif-containing protein [Ureibacillus acetophenoni]|uniref:NUMOD4 motif-containing protein n=2 Tax=Ureibacillus acetophenoni TaxID=614649 RepID=A0A285USU5_9BACL|nr:NUMOD4 motif-containing protein [Ureibacillus acetophenoni]